MPADTSHPHGEVFLDARGQGRALRLTWHHEADVVVLSLWRDRMCAGTFRLSTTDVNEFVDALVDGLRDGPSTDDESSRPVPVVPHTGAIGLSAPEPAPEQDAEHPTEPDDEPEDGEGFVEWALRSDQGRASA